METFQCFPTTNSQHPSKRDFLELEGAFACSVGVGASKKWKIITAQNDQAECEQTLDTKEMDWDAAEDAAAKISVISPANEDIQRLLHTKDSENMSVVVSFEGEGRTVGVVEDLVHTSPGKHHLDPHQPGLIVNFEIENANFVSVACGLSQPEMTDACVGNSQPVLENSVAIMVDCCVGSSQPFAEMKDGSVETTRIQMQHHETMTSPQRLHDVQKRSTGIGFYSNEVSKPKKRRAVLGDLRVPSNQQEREIDYSLMYGKRTLVYPSQINYGQEDDIHEINSSTTNIRVPVLRVGLSKKVRPPRLLRQYRTVPEPCEIDDSYDDEDEDKEN